MKKILSSVICLSLVLSCIFVVPISINALSAVKGDLDKNSITDSEDLILLRKALIGAYTPDASQSGLFDINGDKRINILDLVLLKKIILTPVEQVPDKYILEDFNELKVGGTVPSSECAGYPDPNTKDGTNIRPIAANGYNNSNALTLYSPDGAGTSGQYTVFVNDTYFTFNNTNFAGKNVKYFELWVDFSEVSFRKIAFKLRSGGLYGEEYFTDNLDGDSSMVYYIEENGKWVEKSYGNDDGCIGNFGNYKGFIRIPIEHFVDSGKNPIDLQTKTVDCFGFWFALNDSSMVNKDIVFDELGFVGKEPPASQFSSVRRSSGSFIQTWMSNSWSESRWETELYNMRKSGMDFIILQAVAETSYDTESSKDPLKQTLTSASADYPSDMPEFKNKPSVDMLENCFKACKETGMKVMIGTISDNRYWKFGYSLRAGNNVTNWVNQYAERNDRMIEEITRKYINRYENQFYGWYYNPEVWNIIPACNGLDGKTYAKAIGSSLTQFAASCTKATPGKPMMLSPFVNPKNSNARKNADMWTDIFSFTDFRNGDIFCPQDSIGNNHSLNLDEWYREYKRAVDTKKGLKLWANNENFCPKENGDIAPLDTYISHIKATEPYTEKNVCFSWNHYYAPNYRNSGYDEAYRYYITNGKYDTEMPTVPKISVNGTSVKVESSDNIGIRCIKILSSNKSTVVKTNYCTDNNNLNALQNFTLEKGTYYAQVFDFFSNGSEQVQFTVK